VVCKSFFSGIIMELVEEEEPNYWSWLPREIRNVIVDDFCDCVGRQMVRLTCKEEARAIQLRHINLVFQDACALGHKAICQWIYYSLVTEHYRHWPPDKNGLDLVRPMLFYDSAIEQGHFDLAQWAFDNDLAYSFGFTEHCIQKGNLAAVKWAHAHQFNFPLCIHGGVFGSELIAFLIYTVNIHPHNVGGLCEVTYDKWMSNLKIIYIPLGMRFAKEDMLFLATKEQLDLIVLFRKRYPAIFASAYQDSDVFADWCDRAITPTWYTKK
jgi:hypothetical protein